MITDPVALRANLGYKTAAPEPTSQENPMEKIKKPTKPSGRMTPAEVQSRMDAVRRRLAEIREYKILIASDGLVPDQDDKRLETELIRRILWLEKQLKGPPPKQVQKTPTVPAGRLPRRERGRRA